MIITRDDSISKWMMDEVRNNIGTEHRPGIHVSDLLAPRKRYWQEIKPLPATDEEILYWLSGASAELFIVNISGYAHALERETLGIKYTPDWFHNFPSEFKTRRRLLAKEGKEKEKYDHYLKQLKSYCALQQIPQGWLHVLSLVERQEDGSTKPELASYRVEFDNAELYDWLSNMVSLEKLIKLGIELKDVNIIDQCPDWMCGKTSRIVEKKAFCLDCNKEFDFPERHLKAPKTAKHTVVPPQIKYNWNPKCKWHEWCKPTIKKGE